MNSRRVKKVACETDKHIDSPSKDEFLSVSPNDSSFRARLWHWLDDKFKKQDEYIKQQADLIKNMITETNNNLMVEIEHKFSSLKNEILEQVKNEIKTDIMQQMDSLGVRISALEAARIDIPQLKNDINDSRRDVFDTTQRVTKLETVTDEIIGLRDEVKTLKTQLHKQENSLIASELRINGIPYRKDENALNIFETICDQLRINTPSVKSAYRLQNNGGQGNTSPDGAIMIKLSSSFDKNFILKSLAKFRKTNNNTPLRLNCVGFDSDRPFYINENLTSNNHKILKSAVIFKKAKKLHSAFTLRGLVYVKVDSGGSPIRIDSLEDLENLFRSN